MIQLTIGPKAEAPLAATKHNCQWVISIQDFADTPVDKPLGVDPTKHAHFFFDDLTDEVPIRYSSRSDDIVRGHPPDMQDVQAVLQFFKQIPHGDKVYIHCFAGISRSSAMALMLYAHQTGAGYEGTAMTMTNKSAPWGGIWPNERIVRYADELLNRNGKLIATVEEFKDEQRDKGRGPLWDTQQKTLAIDSKPKKE